MSGEELGDERLSQIFDNLKLVYKDILKEDLPPRFKMLLDELEAQKGAENDAGNGNDAHERP